jgi:lipopolysaccharide assembly outer membrane protein LptD (OstA)
VKLFYRVCSLFLLLLPGPLLIGQTPELSADEPISFNADEGLLIATGNAVFNDENTTVEAEVIRYSRENEQIEAVGNVRVTRKGLRLLAEQVTYDARTKAFSATNFRAGYPPLFIEGDFFAGNLDQVDFSRVSVYFREPVQSAPKLSVREGSWQVDEYLKGRGLSINALGGIGIPLPGITYTFGKPTIEVDASIGYRNQLGAYAQSYWLYPFSQSLAAGTNFDIYSRRGVLIGPAFRYEQPDGRVTAFLNSGWIHDHAFEERGVDLLGNRIDQDRGFADFGLAARDESGSLQFQTRGTFLSDSEVLRDFRSDIYADRYQPDTFAEFTWQQSNFLLNLLARSQINDYYTTVERLPELRAEWLPKELGQTGIFLQATASATRYRIASAFVPGVSFPPAPLGLGRRSIFPSQSSGFDIPPPPDFLPPPPPQEILDQILDSLAGLPSTPTPVNPAQVERSLFRGEFHNRLDATATLTRPFHGPAGTRLILRAGTRWTHYEQEGTSRKDERFMGELGFDLSQTLARTFSVDWDRFNIDRLRHESTLSLKYRWHPWDEDKLDSPNLDVYQYHARPPLLDLADIWYVDQLRDWNVARLGWEHRLLAAEGDSGYRDFLSLNFYQDFLFSAEEPEEEWDAFYTQLVFDPVPWFGLQLSHKYLPEDTRTEAYFLRTILRSSDLWSLGLQVEYLEGAIEQYELAARYRLSEDIGLLASWHYDSRLNAWTEQRYGFTRRFGNVWQLELYITLTDENDREDDFSIGARLNWLSF